MSICVMLHTCRCGSLMASGHRFAMMCPIKSSTAELFLEEGTMEYEIYAAAVFFRKKDEGYEYLLEKSQDGCGLPRERYRAGEKGKECALRLIEGSFGKDIHVDDYFLYPLEYETGSVKRLIDCYLAEIPSTAQIPEHFAAVSYAQAVGMIADPKLRQVLKEADDYLVKEMKVCHLFADKDSFSERDLEFVKDYGPCCNGHPLYTWDEGDRCLLRCRVCGGYVLRQYSEIHMPDSTYIDYFPVRDDEHAREINERYDGWQIENEYPFKKIFFTYNYD